MIHHAIIFSCLFSASCLLAPRALGQIKEETDLYRTYGATVVSQYRVGTKITAKGGAVQEIMAIVAVPFECDEQSVRIIEEDVTSHCESIE